MKKILVTDFAKRHFDKSKSGTQVSIGVEEFEEFVNSSTFTIIPGYADFCKILVIPNTKGLVRTGTVEISLENSMYIRSGYSSRRDEELSVLSRWLELPYGIKPPIAPYLIVIVYSKEQIDKESISMGSNETFQGDWGIVSIQGTNNPYPDPIPPITMLRNALGKEYGGSGVGIDQKLYKESVEFWDNNILIK